MDTTEIDRIPNDEWLSLHLNYFNAELSGPVNMHVPYWQAAAYNWKVQKSVSARGKTSEEALTNLKNKMLSGRDVIHYGRQKPPERRTSSDGSYKPLFTL